MSLGSLFDMEINSVDLNFSAEYPSDSTNNQQLSNPGTKPFHHSDSDDEFDFLDGIMPFVSYLDIGTPRLIQNNPLMYNSSTPKYSLPSNNCSADLVNPKGLKLPEIDPKAHSINREVYDDNLSSHALKRKNSLGPIQTIISFPDEFENENTSHNLDDLLSFDNMEDLFSQSITTSTPKASFSNLEETYTQTPLSPFKHSNLDCSRKVKSETSQPAEFSSGFSSYFARAANRLKRNSDLSENESLFEDVDKLLYSLERNCPDSVGTKRRRIQLVSHNIAHSPASVSPFADYDENKASNLQPIPSSKSHFSKLTPSLSKVVEHIPKVRDDVKKHFSLKSPNVPNNKM